MADKTIGANRTERISVAFYDTNNSPLMGLTPKIYIWRNSDKLWWNGSGWQTNIPTISLSEQGRGYYYYNLEIGSVLRDEYYIQIDAESASCSDPIRESTLAIDSGLYGGV